MSQKCTSNTRVLESNGRMYFINQGCKHQSHGFWHKREAEENLRMITGIPLPPP